MVALVLTSLFELERVKKFLDFSHLRCPMAFVKCKQALLALETGQTIAIQLADPVSITDITVWAHHQALQCQQSKIDNGVVIEFSRLHRT